MRSFVQPKIPITLLDMAKRGKNPPKMIGFLLVPEFQDHIGRFAGARKPFARHMKQSDRLHVHPSGFDSNVFARARIRKRRVYKIPRVSWYLLSSYFNT